MTTEHDAVETQAKGLWETQRQFMADYHAITDTVAQVSVPPWDELTEAHKIVFGFATKTATDMLNHAILTVSVMTEEHATKLVTAQVDDELDG